MTPQLYYLYVRDLFKQSGNPDIAQGQVAYMRHKFEFFGLKMPDWMALSKSVYAELGIPEGDALTELIRLCYADDHREMHYFALETLQRSLKKQPESLFHLLEELICTHSWWDTVDWLAKLTGIYFRRYPHLTHKVTRHWMDSGNFWLQRVCLIFQLLYKDKTDASLMFGYIRELADSKEFFIQKGAAWALRQYSKTNPEAVRLFMTQTPLAPLTRREGGKYLPAQ